MQQRCQRCGVMTPEVTPVDVAIDKPVEYWCGPCAMTSVPGWSQIDDKPDGFVTDWSIEFKGVKRLDNGGAKGDTRR